MFFPQFICLLVFASVSIKILIREFAVMVTDFACDNFQFLFNIRKLYDFYHAFTFYKKLESSGGFEPPLSDYANPNAHPKCLPPRYRKAANMTRGFQWKWWPRSGSNRRPADYEPAALTC